MNQTMEKENNAGDRIRQIRLELKLKQEEFGEKLNISGPSLSEIETGKYKPGFEFLVKLHKVFNVNLYYVFFGQGTMFEDPIISSIRQIEKYAKNIEDIREFLYYLKHSAILQYAILNLYKKLMISDKDLIMKEVEEYNKNVSGEKEHSP